ncbi:MAG: hypothetical protein LBT27_01525 [Prevotellaceae bacterium]|jgi:hypothetical protein|nr:hypothetical protein [Prevotellaceae bacterium]
MIEIKQICTDKKNPDLNLISTVLDSVIKFHKINNINWVEFDYKPEVKFAIAHNDNEIFIKYVVCENSIRAIYSENNGKVWTDSCCEFFVSPDCNDCYYNFEINCIGALRLGYRKLGEKTEHAADEIINSVRRMSSLGNKPFDLRRGDCCWTLVVAIPVTAFFKHNIISLREKTFTANFYKCGDELQNPHYLSWNPIKTEKPSFHQPAFFDKIALLN